MLSARDISFLFIRFPASPPGCLPGPPSPPYPHPCPLAIPTPLLGLRVNIMAPGGSADPLPTLPSRSGPESCA